MRVNEYELNYEIRDDYGNIHEYKPFPSGNAIQLPPKLSTNRIERSQKYLTAW